ncbi:ABC transporter permease [Streptococcaceae bacterium ESL0687]|nr:ABC transporter permease [Streptococcaceae bacterium ESL0687]
MIRETLIVARQVYKSRIKTIGYWGIVLSPLIITLIGVGLVFIFMTTSDSSSPKLGIVNDSALTQFIKKDGMQNLDLSDLENIQVAQEQLDKGDIDGYLEKSDDKYTLIVTSETNAKLDEGSIRKILNQYQFLAQAAQLNLTSDQIAALEKNADLTVKSLDKKGDDTVGGDLANGANSLVGTIAGIFIFTLLTIYVGMIAQEIANEKSSRIMEILLAATGAKVQYYGKLIGVFSLACTQILIYLFSGFTAYFLLRKNELVAMGMKFVTGVDLGFLAVTVTMVLISLFGYLVLASIVASLVNDQSQVQQAVTPVTYLSMVGYLIGLGVSGSPGNLVIKVLSYVPFISQSLMPTRLAIHYADMKEALVALVIELVAVVLIAKGAEKIYAKNVLSYSDDKIIRQLINNFKKNR